jgi:hypothetical protein
MQLSSKDEFIELIFNNIKVHLGMDFEYYFESAINYYKVSKEGGRFMLRSYPVNKGTVIIWSSFCEIKQNHFTVKYLPWKIVDEDYIHERIININI